MDPDEALRRIREAAGEIENDLGDAFDEGSQVGQLVTAFDALDEWLRKGGFVPSDWTATQLPGVLDVVGRTEPGDTEDGKEARTYAKAVGEDVDVSVYVHSPPDDDFDTTYTVVDIDCEDTSRLVVAINDNYVHNRDES